MLKRLSLPDSSLGRPLPPLLQLLIASATTAGSTGATGGGPATFGRRTCTPALLRLAERPSQVIQLSRGMPCAARSLTPKGMGPAALPAAILPAPPPGLSCERGAKGAWKQG